MFVRVLRGYNGNSRFVRLARVTVAPCQTLLALSPARSSLVHELPGCACYGFRSAVDIPPAVSGKHREC